MRNFIEDLEPHHVVFISLALISSVIIYFIPKHDKHGFTVRLGENRSYCDEVIEDGPDHTLFICNSIAECNQVCDQARNKFKEVNK